MEDVMKVTAKPRPFVLVFPAGARLLITSEQAQRLLDNPSNRIESATRNCVIVTGAVAHDRVWSLFPATVGGGAAFEVTK